MLHGQTRYNLPSRFIDEIPAGLLKWLTPKAGKAGFAAGSSDAGLRRRAPRRARAARRRRLPHRPERAHAKFGLGVIVNAEGGGHDARVQVNFGGAGMKWLALSVAKLEARVSGVGRGRIRIP